MAMIHVSRSGAQIGVFDEAKVRAGLETGEFIPTDLGWLEGMATWRPLSEIDEFARLSQAPPPTVAPGGAVVQSALPQATFGIAQGTGLPWENRATLGWVNAFIQTVGLVLIKPGEAFTVMKREGGLADPLLYALIGGCLGAVVGFTFAFLFQSLGFFMGEDSAWASVLGIGAASILVLVLMPLFIVIGAFVSAGVFHVGLMLFGGAKQPFETTFRVVCYSVGSARLLQMLPLCGGAISVVWGIVLYCIGLARAHDTDTGRAVGAVFLPIVVCCGFGILAALLLPALANLNR